MFDFLKNFAKSDDEKQQEAFSAYLDDMLSPGERQKFEALLAEDAGLRAKLGLAQLLRQQMSEMPRRVVPHIFTLDASLYDAPQKEPLAQAYPFLRAATVMAAFFFVLALGLSLFTSQSSGELASVAQMAPEPAPALDAPLAEAEIAMEAAADEAPAEKAAEEMALAAETEEADELLPLPTLTLALTETASMGTELAEESALAADDMTDGEAPAEEAAGAPLASTPAGAVNATASATATATPMPTATISTLPRIDVTETAVPRIAQTITLPQDESANAVEMDTAVNEETAEQSAPLPARSKTSGQWLLIGSGFLLLLLVAVTLLARRRL